MNLRVKIGYGLEGCVCSIARQVSSQHYSGPALFYLDTHRMPHSQPRSILMMTAGQRLARQTLYQSKILEHAWKAEHRRYTSGFNVPGRPAVDHLYGP